MEDMFRSFQDLESELPEAGSSTVPVDIRESDQEVVVSADLPGVEKDQIDIKATSDSLEIQARHEREVEEEQKDYYRRERSARRYHRSVALPAPVDPESAEAEYESGVLTVRLDRKEKTDEEKIEVE
ncbi:MAG: Hsp20/alpha crystallin family protein [Candidatus Nanohaloarchaea archaeon]